MRYISGKEFAKILEQNGWKLLRINGSHHIYGKPNKNLSNSIANHATGN
jgi:predicted RNA binding protein YcfA (HicA-like mRNA interferase family)